MLVLDSTIITSVVASTKGAESIEVGITADSTIDEETSTAGELALVSTTVTVDDESVGAESAGA